MLRLSGRYLGRPLFTWLAHHSQRFCSLFSFTSRDCGLLALAHYFFPLSPEISLISNTFNLYSCILLRKNVDPFDLLCIVLMQAVTVEQEHLRRLLVLQVSWSGMHPSFISRREWLGGVANHRPWDCMLFCPQDNRVDPSFGVCSLSSRRWCVVYCVVAGNYCTTGASSPTPCPAGIESGTLSCCLSSCWDVYFLFIVVP